jgi:hypothetical protein
LKTVRVLGASRWLCVVMGPRVIQWPPDLLCGLQERCSRLQHTLGRGSALLHDPLLVDVDVQLFLDVFPPLTGPCQRCQPWADRVTYGCCWALDESAGAAQVPRRLQPVLSFRAGGCVWPPSSLASRHTRGAC